MQLVTHGMLIFVNPIAMERANANWSFEMIKEYYEITASTSDRFFSHSHWPIHLTVQWFIKLVVAQGDPGFLLDNTVTQTGDYLEGILWNQSSPYWKQMAASTIDIYRNSPLL